ncbi:MAG TPA: asparagine synthase-related protein, partial [Candidatus Peribacteria bacterium]|nr:asparagine synthase-related protein [Candidatus Peribacteria bacterium]
LLKDTYYPVLPASVRAIGKSSFYPPLAKWFRRECAPLVEAALEHARIQELFNVEELRAVFRAHKDHVKYGLHTLQMITQLAAWFDEVYDA